MTYTDPKGVTYSDPKDAFERIRQIDLELKDLQAERKALIDQFLVPLPEGAQLTFVGSDGHTYRMTRTQQYQRSWRAEQLRQEWPELYEQVTEVKVDPKRWDSALKQMSDEELLRAAQFFDEAPKAPFPGWTDLDAREV